MSSTNGRWKWLTLLLSYQELMWFWPALKSQLWSDEQWWARLWGSEWSGWWTPTQRTTSPRWSKHHNTNTINITRGDLHCRRGSGSFLLSWRLRRRCCCRSELRWWSVWWSTLVEQAGETAASRRQFQTWSSGDCWKICSLLGTSVPGDVQSWQTQNGR